MNRLMVKNPLAIRAPYALSAASASSTWYHCGSKRRA
jgi:hypothetical protein